MFNTIYVYFFIGLSGFLWKIWVEKLPNFVICLRFSFWKIWVNRFVAVFIIDDFCRSKASQKSHKNAKSSPSRLDSSSVITDAAKDALASGRRSAKNSTAAEAFPQQHRHRNSRSLSAEKQNRSYSRSMSPKERARDRSSDRSVCWISLKMEWCKKF